MVRITGIFEVKVTPQQPATAQAQEAGFLRLALDKKFHGPLEASSIGEMLASSGGKDPSGGYIAMERVSGMLDGRAGSFVLQHSGTMTPESVQISIVVSPGSGTGELAGIAGTMVIRIEGKQHFYDFDYSLPATR